MFNSRDEIVEYQHQNNSPLIMPFWPSRDADCIMVFKDLYLILKDVLVQRPLISSLAVIVLTLCVRSVVTKLRADQVCRCKLDRTPIYHTDWNIFTV